jgi:hypothetical protein
MTGRALSTFNSAMFVGVAVVQWLSSYSADLAKSFGHDPLAGALACIAELATFVWAPWPASCRGILPA